MPEDKVTDLKRGHRKEHKKKGEMIKTGGEMEEMDRNKRTEYKN